MSSGGRLLDQGLYGCVFVPSLTCQSGTEEKLDSDPRMYQLSKLIPTEDAEQEFTISKRIHRIPFYKQYFVVTESMCTPVSTQPKEKNLPKCEALDGNKLNEMRLLRMPYQGKVLHHVQFSAHSFHLRDFAVHLIAGGALMNLFGIVHRDLHQGNILVDSSNVPRIIDFNLSITVRSSSKPSSNDLLHSYDHTISQEPPDSTLVNAVAKGNSANQVIQSIAFRKPIVQKMVTLLGISKRDIYHSLMDHYKKSKVMRSGDIEKWFSLYYRVIDSWAIGVCLVDLILKLSLWPSFSSKIQDTVKDLIPILRKMCEVHPMKRIDCVQALHLMDPNHIILRRYGKKWLDIVGHVTI
jgi:serine/threonine protein kinase